MAAPHVTGAWAILKSKAPSSSVNTILNAFLNTGRQIRDPRNGITKPRIQVKAALDTLPAAATPTPTRTATPSGPPTNTYTPSVTPSPTQTPTPIGTPTFTPTRPPSPTVVVTPLPIVIQSASTGGITIDGSFVDWPFTETIVVTRSTASLVQGEQAAPDDAMFTFRSAWDSTGLYIGFEVTDDQVKRDGPSFRHDDLVEIGLDARYDLISGNADDRFYAISAEGLAYEFLEPVDPNTGFQVAAMDMESGSGYRVEAKIPWSQFTPPPGPDALVGVNLGMRDDDNGSTWVGDSDGDSYFIWRGASTSQATRAWGALHLAGVVQPTTTPTVTTTPQTPTPTVTGTPPTPTRTATLTPTTILRRNSVYLPMIFRYYPTYPSQPVLFPIANSDGNGTYEVAWSDSLYSDNYELFESRTPDFNNATLIYALTSTRYTATGRAPGVYYYRVRGSSTKGYGRFSNIQSVVVVGAPTVTPTFTLTPTPIGGPSPTPTATMVPISCNTEQALQNGGFEQGQAGWIERSRSAAPIITRDPQFAYEGNWFAYLGGYNNALDEMWQTVAVPPGTQSARITLVLGIVSEEAADNDNDVWGLQIRDANGQVIETVLAASNRQQSPNWLRGTYTWNGSFARYAGQTIQVTFVSVSNGTLRTAFLLDNTQLRFFCGAPTATGEDALAPLSDQWITPPIWRAPANTPPQATAKHAKDAKERPE